MSSLEEAPVPSEPNSGRLAVVVHRVRCDVEEIQATALLGQLARSHLGEAVRDTVNLTLCTVEASAGHHSADGVVDSDDPVRLALHAFTRDYLAVTASLVDGASGRVVQGFEEAQQIISAPIWRDAIS